MISTTEPSGRFVTLPTLGRFSGNERDLPVTMPSRHVATSSPEGMVVTSAASRTDS